jgi:hypothetical protein
MKGFYLEPYLRFANFDLGAPVKYTYHKRSCCRAIIFQRSKLRFTGKVKSTSPGLMIGWQIPVGY